MLDDRLARIMSILASTPPSSNELEKFCVAGVTILGVDGVGICLVFDGVINSQASSSPEFAILDEEQFALGDGPTFDAAKVLVPVVANDLQQKKNREQWPVFSAFAESKEIRRALAVPLHVGDSHLGVLTAYRHLRSDSLIPIDDAVTLAAVVSASVVTTLANKEVADVNDALGVVSQDQSIIHFAAGMVAEQFNIPIIEALVRIRAHAYATGLSLSVVATRIANQTLILE